MHLNVPYCKQHFAFSCFPACIRMVLEYYGHTISERELYHASLIKGHKGCWDAPLALLLYKNGFQLISYQDGEVENWTTNKNVIRQYNRFYRQASKSALLRRHHGSLKTIRKFLEKGIPVLAEVDESRFYGNPTYDGTHVIVIFGMTKHNIVYHDPDPKLGGSKKKMSIQTFESSWENIAEGGGCSLSVIARRVSSR